MTVTSTRKLALVLAAVAFMVCCPAGVAYLIVESGKGDITHPEVAFDARPPQRPAAAVNRFTWPMYGFSTDHTRYYAPPPGFGAGGWRIGWNYRGHALLEFPPVIWRGATYQLADNGALIVLDTDTGHLRWRRKLGRLAASSPVVGGGSVYVDLLDDGSGHGRVMALRSADGFIRWSRRLPSRAESSPMLQHGRLYFGTEDGTVYALRARNGSVVWTYKAHGAVKGSPTLVDGRLYFGDYGGHAQAVRAADGHRLWDSGAGSGGTFYSTAAYAFGRVYLGNTDGREYSFSAANGKLAWAKQTGAYVYSSAAVRDVPGLGPTVYFGSYDGHLYALDARTGAVRWAHRSGGKISGSPTMLGDTVYFADLGNHETIGLDVRTGRPVFQRGVGSFDPVISDGRHLFLTGTNALTALVPRGNAPPAPSDTIPKPPPLRDPSPACARPAPCGPAFALGARQ